MDIKKILEIIALQNNVSIDQIRQDIQDALDIGWNSNDERVQAHWRRIPTKHRKPTLEEVVLYIKNSIK